MESKKTVSLTKNSSNNSKNPSPLKTNAKQGGKSDKNFKGKGIEDSTSSHGPARTMSLGISTDLHNKNVGGHPDYRAAEFDGKGRGFHSKM